MRLAWSWKQICGLLGLAFGWMIIQYGLIQAVFVAAVGALGWLVGRVLDGEVDLSDYLRRPGGEDLE